MQDSRETENTTVYSACREYQSESTIHFDGAPASKNDLPQAPAPPLRLPPDLPLSLVLATPIDTGTAAAGDPVLETVTSAVLDPESQRVLIPARATVHARIVKLEHWPAEPSRYVIAILLETVEIGGLAMPLYARQERGALRQKGSAMRSRGLPIVLPPAYQQRNVGRFTIYTPKVPYRVPVGYENNWTTVLPPA
jgi:hypothetical protein